ncbi:MAG: flavodoxin family protein [Planctomycetes bacterium]|nr:flavodoxin family protein [Planctomycetota bacterium]
MADDLTRRRFFGVAGATAAAGAALGHAAAGAQEPASSPSEGIKILGICGSPRKGKSTAAALQVCLEAAKEVDAEKIEVELIELAGMKINGDLAAGVPLEPGEQDDFPSLVEKLSDPKVAGVIIGTPVYFSNMTARCKAFLDRLTLFRKNDFALKDKVAGVLAVGGARNGGQLLAIESVQAALYGQDMLVVAAGQPTTRSGAAVCSSIGDSVTDDEHGMKAVQSLGRSVAEMALRLAATCG